MSISSHPMPMRLPIGPLGLVLGLIAAELLVLSLAYQHNFDFTCRAVLPEALCAGISRAVPRALGVLGALALFGFARAGALRALLAVPGPLGLGLGLNAAGVALALLPWVLLSDASPVPVIVAGALAWLVGAALIVGGLALVLAPAASWAQLGRTQGGILAVLILAGLALPEVAMLLFPIWNNEAVTEVTFAAVVQVLTALGYVVITFPEEKGIGAGEFFVAVGPQCSGVEGFLLITVFLTLYIGLFRRELRLPHVLILYPIGLVVSWLFNVARISVLLVIGLEGQPELAIGAFHSHAGWLSFTLLSLLLILVSRFVPWFRRPAEAPALALPPFLRDPAVVQILPFLVFMASALLASTFSESPALVYPLRALAMAAVLALVWPGLRALPWRVDALAVGSGLAIGAMWIVTASGSDAGPPFAGLAGAALALWIVARVVGTTLLVPVIEEVFFRGYLMERLAPSGAGWRAALAVLVSAGLFALLHDRWAEALVAGVVFGALVWRSGNVTDAILSHAVANGSIALWVLATGAWHII